MSVEERLDSVGTDPIQIPSQLEAFASLSVKTNVLHMLGKLTLARL